MVDLRASMTLEQFSVIFNKTELEEYALALQERQASYNARNAKANLDLGALKEFGNLTGPIQEVRQESDVFLERKVTQDEAQLIAKNEAYDRYIRLRKEYVKSFEAHAQLEKEKSLLKIKYFKSTDSVQRRQVAQELAIVSLNLLKAAEEKDLKMGQILEMQDHEIYAGLIADGVLPQGQTAGKHKASFINDEATAFSINNESKSQNNQFPIMQTLPEGLVFRVQVGAFKNKVPDYFFREFSPVSGEVLTNGLTAYLAGFFEGSEGAISARNGIRDLGYKDAFVVAYCDGKRIPFAQAVAYEKNGMCRIRTKEELWNEAFAILKTSVEADSSTAAKPKEVFYTVQVASLAKEDNGKLDAVPDLFYQKSPLGNYKYSSGKFKAMAEAKIRREALKTLGFQDAYIVAYRDGIKVSFDEAEIALNYLKEPVVAIDPVNLTLDGTKLKTLNFSHVQFKKEDKNLSKGELGKYNSLRFVTVERLNQLTSAPIPVNNISPLELIYYADFEVQNMRESLKPLVFTMEESSPNAAILHDVALNNNIPFDVIKQQNNRIEFLFYCQKEEEIIRLNSISQKLNIEP
jgi:hypothetical protein